MAITDSMLNVTDINVKIKDNHLLRNIKFTAKSGNILAILGPTAAGKTTLLKVIAGRQESKSGHVTLNGVPFNKQLRRRLGFVLQQDVFFSNLTLWETLYFTAMIRIPEKIPYQNKLTRLNDVIDLLSLRNCIDTKIGDVLSGGLSGGEKRRASIACELLNDPDILLLDEPTSGLDASFAFSLMQQLKTVAKSTNKIMILTIHQPSSRIYNMFDSLLLLANGQVAYFGEAHETPLKFFQNFGFVCDRYFNPADFYMEVLKTKNVDLDKLALANIQSYNKNETNGCLDTPSDTPNVKHSTISLGIMDVEKLAFTTSDCNTESFQAKWPTSFATQLKMLTRRNYMQSKGSLVPLFDVIMYAVLCTCTALVTFQINENIDSIRDRLGLLYFYLVFWNFEPMNQALFAMLSEREIIAKERSAGAYRLSAYYIAKSVSELPLRITMPAIFYAVVYWTSGLGDVPKFFMTLPLGILNALNAQSVGMFLGSAFENGKAAFLCGETVVLMAVLFSGYLTYTFPPWFTWSKYLSIIHYPLGAMGTILFRDLEDIACNATSVSIYKQCLSNSTEFITASDILKYSTIEIPLHCYVSSMCLMFVFIRLATYVALRYRHKAIA